MAAALWISVLSLKAAEDGKKEEATFEVSGVCGMCEDRIESALDVKGIVVADWDLETKQLHVVYNSKKISEEDIHALLNEVGHDTEKSRATAEQYEGLHGCCKYRDAGAGTECSSSKKN
jgi:copper chaperone CopZ